MTSPASTTQPQVDLNGPISDRNIAEKAFWKIFNNEGYKLFSDLPKVWKANDDYREEHLVIKRITAPLVIGGIVTITLFASLRLGPTFQRMIRGGDLRVPRKTPKRNVKEPTPQREHFSSSLTKEHDKRKEQIRKELNNFAGLPLDFMLSTMVGLSLASYLSTGRQNMDRNRDAFETTPLLPGKSLIAQYMCNEMTHVHDRMTPALWKEEEKNITLDSFRRFVKNCKLRDNEVQKIRQETMLTEDDEVMIPSPGISNPGPRPKEIVRNPFNILDPLVFFNDGFKRDPDIKR